LHFIVDPCRKGEAEPPNFQTAAPIRLPLLSLSAERLNLLFASAMEAAKVVETSAEPETEKAAIVETAKEEVAADASRVPLPLVPPQEKPVELPLVQEDAERGIAQPLCLAQWHPDACGHHALFSVRCLLQLFGGNGSGSGTEGRGSAGLLEEGAFWQRLMRDTLLLADYGERSGRWPRDRVTSCILDEIHMDQLIQSDSSLRGRVSIIGSPSALAPGTEAGKALAAVAAGDALAHGFLLECSIHWMALVAVKPCAGRPSLWLCDSYNRPLARLRDPAQVEELAMEHDGDERRQEKRRQQLRARSEWAHQPQAHIEMALQEGVPEWWKGCKRSALFWRLRPRELRLTLGAQELSCLQQYLDVFVSTFQAHGWHGI
jgi:hypothetical protein